MKRLLRAQSGYSLIEIIAAGAILAIVIYGITSALKDNSRQSVQTQQKNTATQKAIQMMEELRAVNATGGSIGALDSYDNGAAFSHVLTTQSGVTDPADVLSGNPHRQFKRQIAVRHVEGDDTLRRVWVRVFRDSDGTPLAEVMAVLGASKTTFFESQVYDLYILSIETLQRNQGKRSDMDGTLQDLQSRNPGLMFRVHWITRMAYGRDPYYSPFSHVANLASVTPTPFVYMDGWQSSGCASAPTTPCLVAPPSTSIHSLVDNVMTPPQAQWTPRVGSMADEFNHAVRYPDEVARYNQEKAYAQANGLAAPEMTLRMLIETLNSNPALLANAMILNLHGGVMPLPPMRNYADAAKDPAGLAVADPWPRAVTHPEKLFTPSGDLYFRIYTYDANPAWGTIPADTATTDISLFFPNAHLNAADVEIRRLTGNQATPYSWSPAAEGVDFVIAHPQPGVNTRLTLLASPLRHSQHVVSNTGLAGSAVLHGLQYIPCETAGNVDFAEPQGTLQAAGGGPRNTARWRLRILNSALAAGTVYTVETRLGAANHTTGTMANHPTNLSRTYAWYGTPAPATERYQFLGDPRHMPYADVKQAHGYNWYFNAPSMAGYTGFTEWNGAGWVGGNGRLNYDLPRFYQLWRDGLMSAQAIFGLNGVRQFGYPMMGTVIFDPAQIGHPMLNHPWDAALPGFSQRVVRVNEYNGDALGLPANKRTNFRWIARRSPAWMAMPWLGELYPDDQFSGGWETNGNLPVGVNFFYRSNITNLPAAYAGNVAANELVGDPFDRGMPTLLNSVSATGQFMAPHGNVENTFADITDPGRTVLQNFGSDALFPSIKSWSPFAELPVTNSRLPPHWAHSIYAAQRTDTHHHLREVYYDSQTNGDSADWAGLGLVELAKTGGLGALFVIMGNSPGGSVFGPTFNSLLTSQQQNKYCLTYMTRAFQRGGASSASTQIPIPQLPRLAITGPATVDPFPLGTIIPIEWSTALARWDGQPYTELSGSYATGVVHVFMKYSPDGGKTWYWPDHTQTSAGTAHTSSLQLDLSKKVTSPYAWDTGGLATGSYLVRLEAYREDRLLHYSYHQRYVYLGH